MVTQATVSAVERMCAPAVVKGLLVNQRCCGAALGTSQNEGLHAAFEREQLGRGRDTVDHLQRKLLMVVINYNTRCALVAQALVPWLCLQVMPVVLFTWTAVF